MFRFSLFTLPAALLVVCNFLVVERTASFPLSRLGQERASTTRRGYSLDAYLETLSQIQSTVNTAGRGNTQAYLESLAGLSHDSTSEPVEEEYTSRSSITSLNYLESLSDIPPTKLESTASTTQYSENLNEVSTYGTNETPLPSMTKSQPLPVSPTDKTEAKGKSTRSLTVDVPNALQLSPVDESVPMKPVASAPINRAAARGKQKAALSPDSTKPSFGERKAMAQRKPIMDPLLSSTNVPKIEVKLKTESVEESPVPSEERKARISMASDYVMQESMWDVNAIKTMPPLSDVTTVLADITENSHVALQNGQDEVTKSLTKWIKSTQKAVLDVPSDVSASELAERIAQGFFSLGELVVTALNLVAESVSGKSLTVAAKSAHEAATEAIASAVASVMTTVQKIGEVSVADVLHSMIELITLIARVMFRIFNGAVEIVSGKSVGQMGQAVTDAFEKEARTLSAKKGELSEKSLYDLVVVLGKFELEAAEAVMSTATNAVQSLEVCVLGHKKASVGL